MKPIELITRAINNSSRANDLVLDPFAGSGSTLIAAEQTRRRARLMEIDPKYCDVIIARYERITGKTAELLPGT
jgi:DNA modification methylase